MEIKKLEILTTASFFFHFSKSGLIDNLKSKSLSNYFSTISKGESVPDANIMLFGLKSKMVLKPIEASKHMNCNFFFLSIYNLKLLKSSLFFIYTSKVSYSNIRNFGTIVLIFSSCMNSFINPK